MHTENEQTPWAWRLLIVALLFALGCSAWTLFRDSACASCDGAAALVHGPGLAILGVLYYSALLLIALAKGPHPVVFGGTLLAAGVHVGLVSLLLRSKLFCPSCIGAALSAGLACVGALRCHPASLYRASVLVPAAALAIQSWGLFGGAGLSGASATSQRQETADLEIALSAPEAGSVRMLVYTRPDCGYCRELERRVLPELLGEFGPHLGVERRSAERLPGIPTPTI